MTDAPTPPPGEQAALVAAERPAGWYWVRAPYWEVAEWADGTWRLVSEDGEKADDFFDEIDERRIERERQPSPTWAAAIEAAAQLVESKGESFRASDVYNDIADAIRALAPRAPEADGWRAGFVAGKEAAAKWHENAARSLDKTLHQTAARHRDFAAFVRALPLPEPPRQPAARESGDA